MSNQFFEGEASSSRDIFPNYCAFCGYKFVLNDTKCQKCNRSRVAKKSGRGPTVQWKKVLHEKQPYEDNYLDETFLSSLISQETPAKLTYSQVFLRAMEVSLATTFLALYFLIYTSMLNQSIDSKATALTNIFMLFPCLLVSVLLSPKIVKLKKIFILVKECSIVICCILILSPVIETFYKNYASNTTYAISYGLIVIHLVLKDYAYVYSSESTVGNKFKIDWSTIAVMYLTVILGSRLQGPIQVFTLWLSTLTLFVFSRLVQKSIRDYSVRFYNYLSLTFIIGMGFLIYHVSKISIIAYLLVNFIIFLIGPLALIWFYQYKNVIHGPWDLPDLKSVEE